MIIEGELHTLTQNLYSEHLGHAIDLMRKSYQVSLTRQTGWDGHSIRRSALSSVLHSYCALDSLCNYFGFEMFFHPASKLYVLPEKRDVLLQRFVKSWDNVQALDKLFYLVVHHGKKEFPKQLENKLRELNNLRNWIAHGISYTTTYLLEPKGPESPNEYWVQDYEHSVNWAAKFPNTKFKPLDELNYEDAKVALTITLESLKLLSEVMNQPISFATCDYDPSYHVLWEDKFDIQKMLKL